MTEITEERIREIAREEIAKYIAEKAVRRFNLECEIDTLVTKKTKASQ